MSTLKFSVFIATSVDGFIARTDGDVSWLHEFGPAEGEPHDDGGFGEFMASVDAMVMGRNTFETVLGFDVPWPYGETPVMVLSQALTEVPAELAATVSIEQGTPEEVAARLAEGGAGRVYLDGGRVIQSFLRAGLVHEITITRVPILLGRGIPLFGEMADEVRMKHLGTRTWGGNFEQSRYEVLK